MFSSFPSGISRVFAISAKGIHLALVVIHVLLFGVTAHAFQPNTIEVGTVEIHPSFYTEMAYNSNISLTHEATPDLIFKEVPGITFNWGRLHTPEQKPRIASPYGLSMDFLLDLYLTRIRPRVDPDYMGKKKPGPSPGAPVESALLRSLKFRRYSVELAYEPQFIQLVDHPEFDSVDHEIDFSVDVRFPGGLYLRLDETFLASTAINTYRHDVLNLTAQERAQGIGYYTNLVAFTAGYNFYADYALFATYAYYNFFLRDFDASQALPDLTLLPLLATEWNGIDNGTLGLALHTMGIYLAKQFQRKTSFSVGYVLGILRGNLEDFGLQGSFIGGLLPFRVRVTEDPRNALLQELRVGFQRILTARQSVFGWQVPKTLLQGEAAFQWRDFDATDIQVRSAGFPDLDIPLRREDFREFLVKLTLTSHLRERTSLECSLSRTPREALGGGGNVQIDWQATLSVTQKIRSKWNLSAYGAYRYGERTLDDGEERDFSEYETGASLAYQIQSWLEAAVRYQFLARHGNFDYNTFDSHRAQLRVAASF